MHDLSQRPERKLISNLVPHRHRPIAGVRKVMLVMPDAIRPHALLIDKEIRLLDVGNLRQPRQRDAKQRPQGAAKDGDPPA